MTTEEKIAKAKELLEGTEAFVVKLSDDPDFLWKLGELLDETTDSYLRQHVRFANHSNYGKDCELSQKALALHFRLQHEEMMSKIRRTLEQ